MRMKEESEKVDLKLNIQKAMPEMASSPISSWQIEKKKVKEVMTWSPKSLQRVTAAMKFKDDYSLEGKL